MQAKIFHLHALSALHCGTGQSAGVVDLPIARARATNLPIVPGSSLRGVLRDDFAGHEFECTLFGPRVISGADDAHAGALAVGDAHLLVLPVRALAGVLAYATCPFILRRYAQDLIRVGATPPEVPALAGDEALHGAVCANVQQGKVVLEDLDLTAKESAVAGEWAERIALTIFPGDAAAQGDLRGRFLVLPDTVLSFLAETATEIRARIAIDPETGTVKKGALWYEENLPAEAVLWGVFALTDSRVKGETHSAAELSAKLPAEKLLQLGGKSGVGRGLTRFLTGVGQ